MRIDTLVIALALCAGAGAQNTHELHMNGEAFVPDTLSMLPGDSIHLVFDTTGHSLVQVPQDSWEQEIAAPLIGLSMGFGTPNPGDLHTFAMDSIGIFYYVCEQHPDEKGLIMVGEEFTSIDEVDLPGIEFHPQPASDRLFFSNTQGYSIARLSDGRGRPVRDLRILSSAELDVSDLPPGIYFITLMDRTGVPAARGKALISR